MGVMSHRVRACRSDVERPNIDEKQNLIRTFLTIDCIRFEFINNDELSFSYYRSWRWFISIIESPSNLINRRLHLIIAWNYIRHLFLIDIENSLFVQQIKQLDDQYMLIQNEFIKFYTYYQNQRHFLIQTKSEYEFLCRRHQIFQQIDLFSDNKSENNLEKYLQYWFYNDKQLTNYFQQLKQCQVIVLLINVLKI